MERHLNNFSLLVPHPPLTLRSEVVRQFPLTRHRQGRALRHSPPAYRSAARRDSSQPLGGQTTCLHKSVDFVPARAFHLLAPDYGVAGSADDYADGILLRCIIAPVPPHYLVTLRPTLDTDL